MKNLIESFFDLLFPTDTDKVIEDTDIKDESFSEKVVILIIVVIVIIFGYFAIH